jgi:hypothetical protein
MFLTIFKVQRVRAIYSLFICGPNLIFWYQLIQTKLYVVVKAEDKFIFARKKNHRPNQNVLIKLSIKQFVDYKAIKMIT